ncbi:hypothetical protein B0H12DRAFT_1146809 [Mycena haematopus]|nr:hypothetical protein B0H12DRAFT_1146809 [Mycena haematopus]
MASPAFGVVAFIVLLSQIFVVNILLNLWPSSIHVVDPDFGDGTPYVFESITSAVLLAIWLFDPALGSQVIKYFATGTALFLAPAWVPPCFDRLHALISRARLPPIYVEANAFWDAQFKRVGKQIVPSTAQAFFRLDPPSISPTAQLAEAVVLPALAYLAVEVSMASTFRLFCLAVCAVRTFSTSRVFRCIEPPLFLVVDVVFWRTPCMASLLFHQFLSYVQTLGSSLKMQLGGIIEKAISWASQQISRSRRRLLQASWSPVFAIGTLVSGLVRNVHEPGAVDIDPRLEAVCFYTAFFFACFMFSGYVHIVHLGYPLHSSILLSAGWAGVLVLYSAVAQYFSPPANLESVPDVLVSSEHEIPPRPANPALVQRHESSPTALSLGNLFQVAKSPSFPRPPSPTPSTQSSSSEEESTVDWTFVPQHSLSRRSLTELPSDLHRALSPIMEVSSAASTSSVAASSPLSSAAPSLSPSPDKTPPGTPKPLSSQPSATPMSSVRSALVQDAQRVSKARAQRDMAEFRSFSLALENKAPARARASGDGDLQSNGAVANNVNANVMAGTGTWTRDEAGGGGAPWRAVGWRPVEFVPKSGHAKAKLVYTCHPNCDVFYCSEDNGTSLI